jgi:FtsZ-binding cell division protein ZapB
MRKRIHTIIICAVILILSAGILSCGDEALTGKIAELEGEVAELRDENSRLASDNVELRERNADLRDENTRLLGENRDLGLRADLSESQLAGLNRDLDRAEREIGRIGNTGIILNLVLVVFNVAWALINKFNVIEKIKLGRGKKKEKKKKAGAQGEATETGHEHLEAAANAEIGAADVAEDQS